MNQPKYEIGQSVRNSPFVVRGIAPRSSGDYLYFVQVIGSDNTFVATLDDLDKAIAIVNDKIEKHYQN